MAAQESTNVEAVICNGLFVAAKDLISCSFEKWYPLMRRSSSDKHTFQSRIIHLNKDFIDYLKEDGVHLPLSPVDNELLKARDPRKVKSKTATANGDESDWSESEDESRGTHPHKFEELELEMNQAIEDLGGETFVKLNWTSPRDASWMNGGTLDCATPGEIYLLLKASDLCQTDLNLLEQTNTSPVLVLRKYLKLNPSMEFRCFIRNGQVRFICQRDASHFHEFLLEKSMQTKLTKIITSFFANLVIPRLTESLRLQSFIADVYVEITSRRNDGKCWLVDVSPLPILRRQFQQQEVTTIGDDVSTIQPHPLVSWDEVFDESWTDVQFLIVTERQLVDQSEQKMLAMNRVPLDMVHGSITSESIEAMFERFRSNTIHDD